MTVGLRTYDQSFNRIVDVTTRLNRVLGIITPARNGSLVDAGFATGTPFAVQMSSSASEEYNISLAFTFNGTTMTWADQGGSYNGVNYPAPISIIYGVY